MKCSMPNGKLSESFFRRFTTLSKLNPVKIGNTVSEMISNDDDTELNVVREYKDAIKLACETGDQGNIDLLINQTWSKAN